MNIRQVPQNVKPVLPVTAMYNTIKVTHSQLEHEKQAAEKELNKAKKVICETALSVFGVRNHIDELSENVRNSFKSIELALKNNGVEIIDYAGETLTEELADRIKIEGWVDGNKAEETVDETFKPEIRWNGDILYTAQVFCSRSNVSESEVKTDETEEMIDIAETEADKNALEVPAEPAPIAEAPEIQKPLSIKDNVINLFGRIKKFFSNISNNM